ncbi:MAG: hypothetical protein ACM3X4_12035 [Ignavibacteriales bacterium]
MATPIGTPPNVIVYEKEGHKFSDFLITGVPLFLMGLVILSVMVPLVCPF